MARIVHRFFGWHKNGAFFLSRFPPDAPVRPCTRYESIDEIKAILGGKRRVEILWWPLLPDALNAEIENGLRLEGRQHLRRLAAAEGE